MCVGGAASQSIHVEIRTHQLSSSTSEFWGLTQWQAPLPTEPSHFSICNYGKRRVALMLSLPKYIINPSPPSTSRMSSLYKAQTPVFCYTEQVFHSLHHPCFFVFFQYFILCVWVFCLCVYICPMCLIGVQGGLKRALAPLVLWAAMFQVGLKLRSSGRAALNHRNHPPLVSVFLMQERIEFGSMILLLFVLFLFFEIGSHYVAPAVQ